MTNVSLLNAKVPRGSVVSMILGKHEVVYLTARLMGLDIVPGYLIIEAKARPSLDSVRLTVGTDKSPPQWEAITLKVCVSQPRYYL